MFRPTERQKEIISDDNRNLLVPASAGTGKTTVMINRILRLLKEEKVNIDEILVITFTKAASVEMRERLQSALSAEPSMYKVLSQLSSAMIGTIHSFCLQLIKSYFYVLDVDPDFTLMDEWKTEALKNRAMKRVFERYYSADDPVFYELIHIFGKRTDSGLADIISEIYSFRECIPDWEAFASGCEDIVTNFNKCVDILTQDTMRTVKYYHGLATELYAQTFEGMNTARQHISKFADALNIGYRLDYFELRDYIKGLEFASVRPPKEISEYEREILEQFRALKKSWTDEMKDEFVCINGQTKRGAFIRAAKMHRHRSKLIEILGEFDKEYEKIKLESGLLDFSSLEMLTMKLLADPVYAEKIGKQYKYVFVDEYQDVNDVQESIIKMLSKNSVCFMVGDIKQSIYGFRMSDPENFLRRGRLYGSGVNNAVFSLTDNFRSDKRILDFTNAVFSKAMTVDFGKCDYENEAMLSGILETHSKDFAPVTVIKCHSVEKPKKDYEGLIRNLDIYDIEKAETEYPYEARVISEVIRSKVGTEVEIRGEKKIITFSDIAVLARTKDTLIQVYETLLHDGVPALLSFSTELLRGDDMKELISYIKVLDNPIDDLSMYSTLCGFFGGFTKEEVSEIACGHSELSLYERLRLSPDTEKKQKFFRNTERFRMLARSMPADTLVSELVNNTGFRSHVMSMERGLERIAVLDAFVSMVESVADCHTLSGLIEFVTDCEVKGSLTQLNDIDAVRLMTVHSSKGLEFPVVFLAGTCKRFNLEKSAVLCDKTCGVALKYYSPEKKKIYPNVIFAATTSYIRKKDKEEELRLLYVAMTRAKYALFITEATEGSIEQKRSEKAQNCYTWINNALLSGGNAVIIEMPEQDGMVTALSPMERYNKKLEKLVFHRNEQTEKEAERIRNNFIFTEDYSNIPVKVVSSKLKALYDDTDEEREVRFVDYDKNKLNTDLGTAYHKLLENIELMPLEREDIKRHAQFLLSESYITQEIYDNMDIELVVKAVNNPDLRRLVDGAFLRFEQKFIARLELKDMVESVSISAPVMLQGAIDLLAVDYDKKTVAIVDYKYTSNINGIKERYFLQLNSYKLAVKEAFEDYEIKGYIYAIKQAELIEVC